MLGMNLSFGNMTVDDSLHESKGAVTTRPTSGSATPLRTTGGTISSPRVKSITSRVDLDKVKQMEEARLLRLKDMDLAKLMESVASKDDFEKHYEEVERKQNEELRRLQQEKHEKKLVRDDHEYQIYERALEREQAKNAKLTERIKVSQDKFSAVCKKLDLTRRRQLTQKQREEEAHHNSVVEKFERDYDSYIAQEEGKVQESERKIQRLREQLSSKLAEGLRESEEHLQKKISEAFSRTMAQFAAKQEKLGKRSEKQALQLEALAKKQEERQAASRAKQQDKANRFRANLEKLEEKEKVKEGKLEEKAKKLETWQKAQESARKEQAKLSAEQHRLSSLKASLNAERTQRMHDFEDLITVHKIAEEEARHRALLEERILYQKKMIKVEIGLHNFKDETKKGYADAIHAPASDLVGRITDVNRKSKFKQYMPPEDETK